MAKNSIGKPPFTLKVLDKDEPLTMDDIDKLLKSTKGAVSLCLRSKEGHKDRGGYFFHFQKLPEGQTYRVIDFERNEIATLKSDHLVSFLNHVSGRRFDPEIHTYCQQVVNLRQDQKKYETGV